MPSTKLARMRDWTRASVSASTPSLAIFATSSSIAASTLSALASGRYSANTVNNGGPSKSHALPSGQL